MTGVPNKTNKQKKPECCLVSSLTILTKLLDAIANESIQKTFEQLLYETGWKMRLEGTKQNKRYHGSVCVLHAPVRLSQQTGNFRKTATSWEQLPLVLFSKCFYPLINLTVLASSEEMGNRNMKQKKNQNSHF